MKKLGFVLSSIAVATLSQSAMAEPAQVQATWRYENAKTGEVLRKVQGQVLRPEFLASTEFTATDTIMGKTVFLSRMASTLQARLDSYWTGLMNPSDDAKPEPTPGPGPGPVPVPAPRPMPASDVAHPEPAPEPKYSESCLKHIASEGELLRAEIAKLQAERARLGALDSDSKVTEAFALAEKLAKNIEDKGACERYAPCRGRRCLPEYRDSKSGGRGGIALTPGGEKGYNQFKSAVENGRVPAKESISAEGFLSEFDLELKTAECRDSFICMHTGTAVDPANKRLYVQISMSSNLDAAEFKREALNVALVIDVSGSMGATDGTERDRLDWTKDAAKAAIGKLNEGDLLTLVQFDHDSKVLLSGVPMNDQNRALAVQQVEALTLGGSTNLEAGLRDGYEELFRNQSDARLDRVILLSDALLNTGTTETSALMNLVDSFARQNVGLTAVGVGEQFNHEFIHAVTRSRGGNYVFAQSGKQVVEFLNAFEYLVTPFAYDFAADVKLKGVPGKLVKTYGIPQMQDDQPQALFQVGSLFPAAPTASGEKTGGAILLEYEY